MYQYTAVLHALQRDCSCIGAHDTFVVIFYTVETTLQLVRAQILSLDLVVERADVGRYIACCDFRSSGK